MSPVYPHIHNPRASAGSLSQGRSYAGALPSPNDPACPSCHYEDSTLPLNTPFSTPPTSSAGSSATRRRRRSSVAEQLRPILKEPPVVVQGHIRDPTLGRSDRHGHHESSRALVVPASSHGHRRSRSETSYSTRSGRYYEAHQRAVTQGYHDAGRDLPHHGRTRFPKKLVSREAAEAKKYPYSVEEDGAITVEKALGQPEIEALVALTEEIRRRSVPPRKAVSFYEKTIVHEVPPSAPSPPPSEASFVPPPRSGTPFSPDSLSPHRSRSNSSSHYPQPVILISGTGPGGRRTSQYVPVSPAYFSNSPPKFEPLHPPGPSTPKPATKNMELRLEPAPRSSTLSSSSPSKTPEEKLAKAEEKAVKAARIAEKKEHRAQTTGRSVDAEDAWKARVRAEELKKKLVDLERKERSRYEKKDLRRRSEKEKLVRAGRTHKGEMILIKG